MKSFVKEKCKCMGSALGLGSNKDCRECGGSGEVLTVVENVKSVEVDVEKMALKNFSDLTVEEKEYLEAQRKARAKREGRDLLDDVVCAWRPMPGCTCGCNGVKV